MEAMNGAECGGADNFGVGMTIVVPSVLLSGLDTAGSGDTGFGLRCGTAFATFATWVDWSGCFTTTPDWT